MLKAVIDTNVLVSGTILSRGNPFEILEAWRRYLFTLITSPEITSEVEAVLRRPMFYKQYGLTESLVSRLITVLNLEALAVNPEPQAYAPGFAAQLLPGVQNIHPRAYARGALWYGVNPKAISPLPGIEPADLKFLACAEAAAADYFVTGDRALLNLRAYKATRIVSPGIFLHILREPRAAKR